KVIPPDHLVRQIDGLLDLSWVHKELAPYYSHTGRPSIDPVLMIRMLIVGYVFALRSERRLCAEVRVNLAYRWFCKLGIEMLAVQAQAAIDTSLPRKSRLPIRKRHGLRGQAWTHSLPMMRTTCSTTRPALFSMPWALAQAEPWRLPSPRPWWTALNAASICGL